MPATGIKKRAKKIKLVLMDVDGVLTDGRLYFLPAPDGSLQEVKGFNAVDGIGIRLLGIFGIPSGVITGRNAGTTGARARMLGMKYAYMGFVSKLKPLADILKREGIAPGEVCYIGDDLTDIPLMRRVGLACAVKNATGETKKAAHYVTAARGGEGAVREVCDLILKSQGRWPAVMENVEQARWPRLDGAKIVTVTSTDEH